MFNDGLDAIKDGIQAADSNYAQPQSLADNTISQLEKKSSPASELSLSK